MADGTISLGDVRLTLEQFHHRARCAATGLAQLGLKTGDTLALLMRNEIEFMEATFAAAALGCYPVPVNWHFHPNEVEYVLRNCEASIVVGHTDLLQQLGDHLPDGVTAIQVLPSASVCKDHNLPYPSADPRWPQWGEWLQQYAAIETLCSNPPGAMLYTGGTTGHPKGVRYQPPAESKLAAMTKMRQDVFGLQASTRALMSPPLYHSAPFSYAQGAVRLNADLHIMARFSAESLLATIERERITHLYAVPTMFVRLLKLPPEVRTQYDLSSLQWVIHAAAPCAVDVKEAMINWLGPVIYEAYAATETGWLTICNSEESLKHPGTVGKPLDGATVKVIGENGQTLPTGEAGDVYGRHDAMPDFTYYGLDDKRRTIEHDGLITAGDIGYFDEQGYLYLCDRKIDMIISGGVNIYPAEIEAAMISLPEIADCAVFGIPDDEFGERVAAAIQPVEGSELNEQTVASQLRDKIAGYKIPKHFEFVSKLPRLDSGKLLRRKLRDPFWVGKEKRI
jgi:long-chain acyl-CoA synthetase